MMNEITHLLKGGVLYFLIAGIIGQGLGIQPHLLTRQAALAFVEGIFHGGGKIDIDRAGPLARLTEMGHDTAAVVPVASIFRLIASLQQHLGSCLIIVDRGKARSLADQGRLPHREIRSGNPNAPVH